MRRGSTKVAVVGAGSVGTAIAYAALLRGVADRFTVVDVDEAKAEAEVLDLNHGLEFMPPATVDMGSTLAACHDADVVVLTAGAKQQPGQSRLDLARANIAMCRTAVPEVFATAPDAVLLVVTNPVDVITHVAAEMSSAAPGRVFGSGTVLDSSRLRYVLARACGVAVPNVHAHVVGEHGDSEVVLWSTATIGGVPVDRWRLPDGTLFGERQREELARNVREAAYRIIADKGATSWAIGVATARILEAVLRDEQRVLPVTAPLEGQHGLHDVSVSLPRIVGRRGAGMVLPVAMTAAERRALHASADAVRGTLERSA